MLVDASLRVVGMFMVGICTLGKPVYARVSYRNSRLLEGEERELGLEIRGKRSIDVCAVQSVSHHKVS